MKQFTEDTVRSKHSTCRKLCTVYVLSELVEQSCQLLCVVLRHCMSLWWRFLTFTQREMLAPFFKGSCSLVIQLLLPNEFALC